MDLRKQIRTILREETNPLSSAFRRVNFTDDDIKYYLKKFSLRFLDDYKNINLMIDKICNFTSYELIEPGLLHMSDKDADNAVNELSIKIKDKYGDFIKNYIDEVISSDDDKTYCFRKHSDKYMDMLTNRGFGECVKGWVRFMDKYGSWFPDLNWNEVREKLDSNPNKYILIKNPLENHVYHYYFSVLKKS